MCVNLIPKGTRRGHYVRGTKTGKLPLGSSPRQRSPRPGQQKRRPCPRDGDGRGPSRRPLREMCGNIHVSPRSGGQRLRLQRLAERARLATLVRLLGALSWKPKSKAEGPRAGLLRPLEKDGRGGSGSSPRELRKNVSRSSGCSLRDMREGDGRVPSRRTLGETCGEKSPRSGEQQVRTAKLWEGDGRWAFGRPHRELLGNPSPVHGEQWAWPSGAGQTAKGTPPCLRDGTGSLTLFVRSVV